MKFPIFANITKASLDFPTAATLKIDGNAGEIPTAFQWAQLSEAGKLLAQAVAPMTAAQWAGWKDQEDAEYITQSTAENLGLQIEQFPEIQAPIAAEIQKSDAAAVKEELRITSIGAPPVEFNWSRVQTFEARKPNGDFIVDENGDRVLRETTVETGSYLLTKEQRGEFIAADNPAKLVEFVAAAIGADLL